MAAPAYEFTAKQNAALEHLASRMRIVGAALMLLAALLVAGALLSGSPSVLAWLAAAVLGYIGFWSARGAREMDAVVATEGGDVPHLMRAIAQIARLYDFQYWMLVAALVVALVTLLAARYLP